MVLIVESADEFLEWDHAFKWKLLRCAFLSVFILYKFANYNISLENLEGGVGQLQPENVLRMFLVTYHYSISINVINQFACKTSATNIEFHLQSTFPYARLIAPLCDSIKTFESMNESHDSLKMLLVTFSPGYLCVLNPSSQAQANRVQFSKESC